MEKSGCPIIFGAPTVIFKQRDEGVSESEIVPIEIFIDIYIGVVNYAIYSLFIAANE